MNSTNSRDARTVAQDALANLRFNQSFGLSLKKAVKLGLVRIVLTDEPNYHDRKAEVVKVAK